ncbi:MAG: hypothetical protein EBZ44_05800 [Verrucomicrobia bacterium]|nr:hypothetical protein [bacterium]NDA10103.1 hypothetical protein [Verrucomicrobiota bacterium]NDD57214.1 hypothetical protein [Verrucomicrobiota bacterium]NDD82289.1 hypothetical protein [Verrucomicrobiota bacterium]
MAKTPVRIPHDSVHDEFRKDYLRIVHIAENLEIADQHLAFPQVGGCIRRQEAREEKMIEAIKYVFFAAGIVATTMLIVFVACFGAWLFDKWRKER